MFFFGGESIFTVGTMANAGQTWMLVCVAVVAQAYAMATFAMSLSPESRGPLALMAAGFVQDLQIELSPDHFLAYCVPKMHLPLHPDFDCATEYKKNWESGSSKITDSLARRSSFAALPVVKQKVQSVPPQAVSSKAEKPTEEQQAGAVTEQAGERPQRNFLCPLLWCPGKSAEAKSADAAKSIDWPQDKSKKNSEQPTKQPPVWPVAQKAVRVGQAVV